MTIGAQYQDIIDNQLTGHEYLRRIGLTRECPQQRCVRFGWQIDMFAGFSGATPTLWAMAGFDGMFSRFEGTEAQRLRFSEEQAFEFLWDASGSLPSNRTRIWNRAGLRGTPRVAVGIRAPGGGGLLQ